MQHPWTDIIRRSVAASTRLKAVRGAHVGFLLSVFLTPALIASITRQDDESSMLTSAASLIGIVAG